MQDSHREDLEQEATHATDEARMVLPGIQAILGFQLVGAGGAAASQARLSDRQYRLGDRPARQQGAARLFDDQGRHPRLHALAAHLLPRAIRVNAVAPGPVWTPLNPADKEAADVSQFGAQTPMKRPAQPEEIAPAYVFLASPQCSSFITGEILPIIGGY